MAGPKGQMVTPQDKDYQQTKWIKQTGIPLIWPFDELADWITTNYSLPPLNLFYDTIIVGHRERPRLMVIFETPEDAAKFREPERFGNFKKEDQRRVREKFGSLITARGDPRFSAEGLIVPFVAFEPVAIVEAVESVTKEQLEQLRADLANDDLWQISRLFNSVTFLFFTDAQAAEYESEGLKAPYSERFLRLVEPHDEFGYIKKRGISVRFDSKENFDKNYQGNWFYYYK
jgi:hypothetical protein